MERKYRVYDFKGTTTFVEIGPGKVLSGLIKRINKEVKALNIDKLEDIKSIQMINLENKNIILPGATGGIGNSIVDMLLSLKANLLITGTNIKKLDEIKSKYKNVIYTSRYLST